MTQISRGCLSISSMEFCSPATVAISPKKDARRSMKSSTKSSTGAYNMVFTQGHGFVVGAAFGLPRTIASMTGFGLRRRGYRLFGNVVSFW